VAVYAERNKFLLYSFWNKIYVPIVLKKIPIKILRNSFYGNIEIQLGWKQWVTSCLYSEKKSIFTILIWKKKKKMKTLKPLLFVFLLCISSITCLQSRYFTNCGDVIMEQNPSWLCRCLHQIRMPKRVKSLAFPSLCIYCMALTLFWRLVKNTKQKTGSEFISVNII